MVVEAAVALAEEALVTVTAAARVMRDIKLDAGDAGRCRCCC